ncbi:hemagglutinin repeat-containing protein [Collimonas antrihumi]|uniref:hemagglutinin repeat-containing protein n=1 Tax=Collimonas antrihumi TaxID=1940615 RepID=UPI001B8C9F12|nr:hemagglutinin repeat-containing protein [Collimonas antrihumi]
MIDRAANGVPVVQIVQPNGAGLSHNKYEQFSVDLHGVILNNNPTAVSTQLGGYIEGNGQINTPANIILNEVMSTSRSHLNGYIEVAGQRAEVIVANPNGISAGGGAGFINTARGVLTTGAPVFGGDGSLAAFRVARGDIDIGAGGMNGTGTEQLDLIARSVSVNDKLFANRLNVVTGAAQVDYGDLGNVQIIAGEGGQPAVGIDSAMLGGMYAQKIRLVGNEHGVAVKLLGDVAASAGNVTISNDGKVTLNNKTNASGQITIHSSADVDNGGTLYARQVDVNSGGRLSNSGTMAAQGDLNVNGAAIYSTGVLAAGIDADGKATQAGNLALNADGTITAIGQNTAGGNLAMTGASIDLSNADTSSNGSTALTATAGDLDHSGANLQAAGGTALHAAGTLINDQGVINTAHFTSNSDALSNVGGSIIQSDTGDTTIATAGVINNTSGIIATNATNLHLQSGSLLNDAGHITHAGAGTLAIDTGGASNVDGDIATNGQLLLIAASLDNQTGSLIANRNAALNLAGNLNNVQGMIQAANALQVSVANIDNTAGRVTSLDSSGLTLNANGRLTNAAGTTADGAQGGIIGGNGDVAITAVNATNSGSITAGNNLSANIQNQLDNNGGRMAAANTLTAQAAALSNTQGVLDAARINATVAQLNNNGGQINADRLTLHATNLSNQQGRIAQFGDGASIIDVADTLDNSNGGLIQTNSTDLTLTPLQLINDSGTISHAGAGQLTVNVGSGALHNSGGTIGSNGTANVTANAIENRGGTLFGADATSVTSTTGDIDNSNGGYLGGDRLTLSAAGQVNNAGGKVEAINGGLAIDANNLNNAAGTVQSLGNSALNIRLRQGLSNTAANGIGGFIGSAGDLNVNAADIDNTEGTFYSKQDLSLNADGTLANTAGVMQSDASLSAMATHAISNSAGRIEANGDLSLVADNLSNTGQGQVISAADMRLAIADNFNNSQGGLFAARNLNINQAAATLNNSAGSIGASGDINVVVASLDNSSGHIGNTAGDGGNITLSVSGNLTNTLGNIGADKNVSVNAATIVGEGKVIAGQDAAIHLQGDYINTADNQFTANRDLSFSTSGTLTNAGNLEAVRNLSLAAANVTNQYGALINAGNGSTLIQADGAVYNLGRIYGDDVAIGAQSITNDGILNADGSTSQAGVIASRNDMDLGAATIVNREHAIIQSLNDMTFGGSLDADHKAVGNSASILNASATIDAGNNLTLQTANLTNRNDHFETGLVIDPAQTTHVAQYRAWNSGIWYDESEISWSDSGRGGIVLVLPGGGRYEQFYKRDYTQVVEKTEVIASAPGQITSGNNMTLSGNVINDKSTMIAGGTLGGQVGDLHNIGAEGEVVTTNQMTAWQNYYHWVSGSSHNNNYTYDNNGAAYDVALPSSSFMLPVWTVLDQTRPDQGDNGAIGSGVGNSTVPAAGSSTIGGNQGGQDLVGDGPTVGGVKGSAGGNTGTSGSPQTIGTANKPLPNLTLPNSQLFPITQNPNAGYLIETDPKFTNYGNFISSNYMLERLGIDPMAAQKRLGDGFYEQKLINDQIAELTGKRFLGSYTSNEAQYAALMDAGVSYAQQFQLTPGIALTAAQMANLTSDLVWLVAQDVTLPDGTGASVLVPVVYLSRTENGDVSPSGAVMSGRDIDLSVNGTLNNGGTLQASNNTLIHATDINNTGAIRSDAKTGTTVLVADNDLINGGSISGNRVGILAGRDMTMASTTSAATSKNGTNIGLGQVATVNADQLSIQSGRDIHLAGAAISTTGDAAFVAGRDINLNTVTTQATSNVTYGAQNHLNESQTQAVGAAIQSGGNVTLAAGQDINANAAYVNADQNLSVAAGRDVNLNRAQETGSKDQEIYTTSSGFMSSSSSHMKDQQQHTQSVGTTLSGDNVQVVAGRDVNVTGSNVVGTHDVAVVAGNNVNIVASQNTSSGSYSTEEKKSGLMSSGGVGFTAGSQEQQNAQTSNSLTHNASIVGSTDGNIVISAGNAYTQTGSNVLAPNGDTTIVAKSVDINAAIDTSSATQDSKFKQSGVTVAVTNPIISGLQTAQQMNKASSNTDDSRMQTLAGAVAGLAAYNTYNDVAKNPGEAGGYNVSVSVGSSKSESHSAQASSAAQGSNVTAGGNVNIIATGGGNDSNINVIGSNITAGNNANLIADNNINLQASQDTFEQHSNNSSSSASVGVGFGTSGWTVSASASQGRGNADGQDVKCNNTHVTAGNQLNLISGGDTNLIGAVASADKVLANVGGNLTVQSLQDTSTYDSQQKNVGVGVTIPLGAGAAGVNVSKSNVDSNYISVGEQSGIKTGDGGFDVVVAGNTNLVGGVIASTDRAVDEAKNNFTTGSLTHNDLENHADYRGQSVGISAGVGTQPASSQGAGVGYGSESGNADSTTHSGVSGIAGNAAVRSDDVETGIGKIFDQDKVQKNIDAQTQITLAFSQQAPKAIGTFAGNQADDLKKQAANESDPGKKAALLADAKKWDEGGEYRIALHTVAGALGGGVGGALGAGAAASAAPLLQDLQNNVTQGLIDAGMSPQAAQLAAQTVAMGTAAGLGAVASGGSVAGAGMGLAVDTNNRQLHPDEKELAKRLAQNSNGKYTVEQVEDAMRAARNNLLGEGVGAGAIVNVDGSAATVYDEGAKWSVVQNQQDGSQQLVQQIPLNVSADLMDYIQQNAGDTYSWSPAENLALGMGNPSSANNPFAQANCVGTQCSVVLINPQLPTRDQLADTAGFVSTQAGWVGSTAALAGAVPGPHTPAAEAVALLATTIGLGSGFVEQILRPNPRDYLSGSGIDIGNYFLSERYPLFAPVLNGASEVIKNSP